MQGMEAMRLLVAGDSWTYGSEIRDPALSPSVTDWDRANDHYRIPRIWPTKLGKLINAKEVVNLSYPASSNDRIVRVTKDWLIENYLHDKRPTDDLFLVVGFTSPERKDFYYKDHDTNSWVTIWPMWEPNYRQHALKAFHKIYVKHMWNLEEYVNRYVNQILDLQNLCNLHGIKYLFFQGFYQHANLMINNWKDGAYASTSPSTADRKAWELIDQARFMNKNQENHSFHSYIMDIDRKKGTNEALITQHPSEKAHGWWAEKIHRYCTENDLW
jgi:hypothetical protein